MKKDIARKLAQKEGVLEKSKKIYKPKTPFYEQPSEEKEVQKDEELNTINEQKPSHQSSPFLQKFSYVLQQLKQNINDEESGDEDVQKKQPYTLLEDVQILYQVMCTQENPYGVKLWKYLEDKKILNRSSESLRDRYRKYLKYLSDENLQEIFEYMQQKSSHGFLEFKTVEKKQQDQVDFDKQDIVFYKGAAKDTKYLTGILSCDPRIAKNQKLLKKKK